MSNVKTCRTDVNFNRGIRQCHTPGKLMSIVLIICSIVVIFIAILVNKSKAASVPSVPWEMKDTSWYDKRCRPFDPTKDTNHIFTKDKLQELLQDYGSKIMLSNKTIAKYRSFNVDFNKCKSEKVYTVKAVYQGESSSTFITVREGNRVCPLPGSIERTLTFVNVDNFPKKQWSTLKKDIITKYTFSTLIDDDAFNEGIFGKVFKNVQIGDVFLITYERKNLLEMHSFNDKDHTYQCNYNFFLLDAKPTEDKVIFDK